MDTLVYTATLFLIPINIAAYNKKWILMNVMLLLCLTSWAHHASMHVSGYREKYDQSVYDILDEVMCWYAIYYSFMYGLFFTTPKQFIIYCICLVGVFISHKNIVPNPDYTRRGVENWHVHVPHICMHLSALGGFIAVSI